MIGNLFRRRPKPQLRRVASTPQDTVVWSVGDVHGRLDLLKPLTSAILDDFQQSQASNKVLVFLGDYVDRGPDSRGVIEFLCELEATSPVEVRFLRGNHEDRMEAFVRDPSIGPNWCEYGGREALRSYGVTPPTERGDQEGWASASAALGAALDDRQRAFLRELEMSITIGDYFFAHAGAKPGVPLDEQSNHDLMWVRQNFLDDPRAFDRVVVHGHTPTEGVFFDHRRIGVDTGAYATGVLSAIRLENEKVEAFQTAVTGAGVQIWRVDLSADRRGKGAR